MVVADWLGSDAVEMLLIDASVVSSESWLGDCKSRRDREFVVTPPPAVGVVVFLIRRNSSSESPKRNGSSCDVESSVDEMEDWLGGSRKELSTAVVSGIDPELLRPKRPFRVSGLELARARGAGKE